MSESKKNLLSAEVAHRLWERAGFNPPPTCQAMIRRQVGPPRVIYKGTGTPPAGRTMYDRAALLGWILASWPPYAEELAEKAGVDLDTIVPEDILS